ncbi:integumentary mucin C.1-like [Diabrotica virgifera virgifera]|uniref:Integumentary mucin C.1-like n=1 Tax=Diabrotica virgifera virgifera TaxID=50390 RepID=A0A6P7G3S9_DIAVI|nr:integumentary mucin C.1-like [Diabrotica virgifera virgifera]
MNLIKCICAIFCIGIIISESTFIFPNPLDQIFTRPCIWVIIRRRPPFPTLGSNDTLPVHPPVPSAPGTVAQTTIATNQAEANPATTASAAPAAETTTTVVAETTAASTAVTTSASAAETTAAAAAETSAATAESTMAMELSTSTETTTIAASTTIAESSTAAHEAAETTTVPSK